MAAFLPDFYKLGRGGVQPVSRDFQPVWGKNPFLTFLISPKSTEILYPPPCKIFGEKRPFYSAVVIQYVIIMDIYLASYLALGSTKIKLTSTPCESI